MPTISDPIVPAGAPRGKAERIWCSICGTNEHLILDSVEPLKPPLPDLVEIAYTCMECDTYYAHVAEFQEVVAILNQRGSVAGVLQFGGEYIHCGEPMKIAGTGFHSVYAPMSTEDPAIDLLDVYLATKVLQCRCEGGTPVIARTSTEGGTHAKQEESQPQGSGTLRNPPR